MPRVIATSDLHLGACWSDMSRKAKEKRLGDLLKNLDRIVDYAIEQEADVLVIAGDIFHKKGITELIRQEFAKRIRKARHHGVHVVLVAGNHDRVTPGLIPEGADSRVSRIGAYGVTVKGEGLIIAGGSIQVDLIDCKDGEKLGVVAVPYFPQEFLEEKTKDPAEYVNSVFRTRIKEVVQDLRKRGADHVVLVTHGSVEAAITETERKLGDVVDYCLSLESLRSSGADLVIIGHVHKPQEWKNYGVWYPGSIERLDFGEINDQKSFIDAVLRRTDREVKRIPLECRPMFHAELSHKDYGSVDEILRDLREIYGESLKDSLLRVRVRTNLRTSQVRRAIEEEFSPLYVLVERVKEVRQYKAEPVPRPKIEREHLKKCLKDRYPTYEDEIIEEAVNRAIRLAREVESD